MTDSATGIQSHGSHSQGMSTIKARFAEFLLENEQPSEHTIRSMKNALNPWTEELLGVERTINALTLILATLHKQRDQLQGLISSFDSAFSPARRLSDDVLAEIFYHCLPTHRNPIPIMSESPLNLTHVCRQWRLVALSSPRLWNRIHVLFQLSLTEQKYDPDQLCGARWQLRLAGIKAWLARSYDLPLSISLRGERMGATIGPMEQQGLQILVDNANRIQSLEIHVPRSTLDTLHSMIDITPGTLPLLRYLRVMENHSKSSLNTVYAVGYTPAPTTLKPLHSWLSLPTLQAVHMCHSSIRLPQDIWMEADLASQSSLWPISCSHLTRFSLYMPTSRYIILGVLRSCPLLEECYLCVGVADQHSVTVDTDPSPIELVNLRCLTIEKEIDSHGSLFFLVKAPFLVSLSLFPGSVRNRFVSFIEGCTLLDKLTVNPSDMSILTFISVLQSASSITQLVLDYRQQPDINGLSWPLSRERQHYLTSTFQSVRPASSSFPIWQTFLDQKRLKRSTLLWRLRNSASNIPDPLVPNLKSFTAIMKMGFGGENPHDFLEFLTSRLPLLTNTPPSIASNYPTASLDSVTLILDGHPEMDSGNAMPLDLAAEVARHAESIGRTIGVDIFLDISYPWKLLYEVQGKKDRRIPGVLVSAKEGLNEETDCTWPFCHD